MLYKTNFKILKVIIGAMLLVFLLQSCNYPYYPLPTCSHPWLVVGFDAESIGTTTGDLEITMYADWEEYIWGVQIGHEFFDKIAREYKFWDMKANECRESIERVGGEFYNFNDADRESMLEISKEIAKTWIAEKEAAGIPGQALYDLVVELVAKHDNLN